MGNTKTHRGKSHGKKEGKENLPKTRRTPKRNLPFPEKPSKGGKKLKKKGVRGKPPPNVTAREQEKKGKKLNSKSRNIREKITKKKAATPTQGSSNPQGGITVNPVWRVKGKKSVKPAQKKTLSTGRKEGKGKQY